MNFLTGCFLAKLSVYNVYQCISFEAVHVYAERAGRTRSSKRSCVGGKPEHAGEAAKCSARRRGQPYWRNSPHAEMLQQRTAQRYRHTSSRQNQEEESIASVKAKTDYIMDSWQCPQDTSGEHGWCASSFSPANTVLHSSSGTRFERRSLRA